MVKFANGELGGGENLVAVPHALFYCCDDSLLGCCVAKDFEFELFGIFREKDAEDVFGFGEGDGALLDEAIAGDGHGAGDVAGDGEDFPALGEGVGCRGKGAAVGAGFYDY